MTAECPYTLQWDTPFPLKIVPSMGDLDPHLIHGSWAHPSPWSLFLYSTGDIPPDAAADKNG